VKASLQVLAVMDRADLRNVLEQDFSVAVSEFAEAHGFRVHYARKSGHRGADGEWKAISPRGWPDLFCVNATQGRVVAAELKKEDHRTDAQRLVEQRAWLADLNTVPGIEAFMWLPSDAAEIQEKLR